MDFETVLKILVTIAVAVAIPIAAYAAVVATRSIWGRSQPADDNMQELDALRERVRELEAMQGRMTELEERVEFAERMLVQQREPARLPGEAR